MTDSKCSFCSIPPDRIVLENDYAVVIRDGFPVSEGHSLIIPKRHVSSWFETHAIEKAAILQAMDEAKEQIDKEYAPDGYNVGIIVGVVDQQSTRYFSYGETEFGNGITPDENSVFEIGSVSKVFTSILLADMVARGEVKLDDPIPQLDLEMTVQDEEQLVLVFVVVPDELPFELGQLDLLSVQLSDDPGAPVIAELR